MGTDVCVGSEFGEVNTVGISVDTGSGIGIECEVKVEGNVSGKAAFLQITYTLAIMGAGTGDGTGE